MAVSLYPTEAARWYMDDFTSRVVAKSGKQSDRYHLGKLILQGLKDAPDFVLQIDGATKKSETFKSALNRSVRCALALRDLGIGHGCNIIVMGPHHLELSVPIYAALYLGVGIGCIDMTLSGMELRGYFECVLPNAVFCQSEKAAEVAAALKDVNLNCTIITFDEGSVYKNLSQLLQQADPKAVENFKPNAFDTEETVAFHIATSGTTGLSKAAEVTHKSSAVILPHLCLTYQKFPTPTRLWFVPSPIQWLTAIYVYLISPIMRVTRLQSSSPITMELIYKLIDKYRPTITIMNPNMLMALLKPDDRHRCDLTSFEIMYLGGSAVPQSLYDTVKSVTPNTQVYITYGLSEVSGVCFVNTNMVPNSCGQIFGPSLVRLVDPYTGKDVIDTPNVPGEVWLKGMSLFKRYSNNPSLTKASFSEDGWFKSGDIFYRDANWNFYFVDRIKMLLKYKNHQISPAEIEDVIRKHPGVLDVAVTGIPHPDDGELPVACVVKQTGVNVTAKDIEDLVAASLTDTKRLRGGVIFMDQLPLTPTSKINRAQLKEVVQKHFKIQAK